MNTNILGIVPNEFLYIAIAIVVISAVFTLIKEIWRVIMVIAFIAILWSILDRMDALKAIKGLFDSWGSSGTLKQITVNPANSTNPPSSGFTFDTIKPATPIKKVESPKADVKTELQSTGEFSFDTNKFNFQPIPEKTKPEFVNQPMAGELCFDDDCNTPKSASQSKSTTPAKTINVPADKLDAQTDTKPEIKKDPIKQIVRYFKGFVNDNADITESPPLPTCQVGVTYKLKGETFNLDSPPKTALCVNSCVASVKFKDPSKQQSVGVGTPLTWFDKFTKTQWQSPYINAKIVLDRSTNTGYIEGEFTTIGGRC